MVIWKIHVYIRLPGCLLHRHVLCEDADNSVPSPIESETSQDNDLPHDSEVNIDDNLNDALLDSPIYQNMLSVEPALNRSSLNETAAANITSVKKFSCLFDQLDYEMLPLSAFQVAAHLK